MYRSATQPRPSTSAPGDGSRTITITSDPTKEEGQGSADEDRNDDNVVRTLRLRGQHTSTGPRVTWDEDVVDNEGAGKKKSKICCIFRPTRNFDESSSDSDSDSDDSSCDGHNHDRGGHSHAGGSNSSQARPGPSKIHECYSSDDEKNAYERMPSFKKKKGKQRPA